MLCVQNVSDTTGSLHCLVSGRGRCPCTSAQLDLRKVGSNDSAHMPAQEESSQLWVDFNKNFLTHSQTSGVSALFSKCHAILTPGLHHCIGRDGPSTACTDTETPVSHCIPGRPSRHLGLGLLGCRDVLGMPGKRELLEGRSTSTMAIFGSKNLFLRCLLGQ